MERASTRGLSWDNKSARATAAILVLALVATTMVAARPETPAGDGSTTMQVIVREATPQSNRAEQLVETLRGTVDRQLGVIGGFAASIPVTALQLLVDHPAITSATPDGTVQMHTAGWESSSILDTVDFRDYAGSLYTIARATNANDAWGRGATGLGVDVALIDTGVAPVRGLPAWKVVNGADLSFESQSDELRYLDGYGHGTHMAGIISGLDVAIGDNLSLEAKDSFIGMAPFSRIVNVRVGAHNGAVDVSQVIAAIDWVVQHKDDNGLNIRVLNLSFGTNGTQDYLLDPLSYAAEMAWNAGIVVVVAAGNDGTSAPLRNPATSPHVIAVGSAQDGDFNIGNNALVTYDRVSDFSSCGTESRHVDLLAPGKSITSLRVPGSYADEHYSDATVADRFFLGSGTSQAAAVVAGAAAQVLSLYPRLSPDEVKYLLVENASQIAGVGPECQGGGVLDLAFLSKKLPNLRDAHQTHASSVGTGELELARGDDHLTMMGPDGRPVDLVGEIDIMGSPWHGFARVETVCTTTKRGKVTFTTCQDETIPLDTLWEDGDWNGTSWSGTSWSGTSWSGTSWSSGSWSGTSWSGTSWSGTSWSDKVWESGSWSSGSWSGTSWTGTSWSGTSWTGIR